MLKVEKFKPINNKIMETLNNRCPVQQQVVLMPSVDAFWDFKHLIDAPHQLGGRSLILSQPIHRIMI